MFAMSTSSYAPTEHSDQESRSSTVVTLMVPLDLAGRVRSLLFILVSASHSEPAAACWFRFRPQHIETDPKKIYWLDKVILLNGKF